MAVRRNVVLFGVLLLLLGGVWWAFVGRRSTLGAGQLTKKPTLTLMLPRRDGSAADTAAAAATDAPATAAEAAGTDAAAPEPTAAEVEATEAPTPRGRVPVAIVTASSSNHFCWESQLIVSIKRHEPSVLIIFYDLGHTESEVRWFQSVDGLEYRRFPFEKYPAHFDINVAAGEYAWKPVMIANALDEADYVIWMDAGDRLEGPLEPLIRFLDHHGFYSWGSQGDIQRWAHQGSMDYLKMDPSLRTRPNCNGAFLGFSREHTRDTLVKAWVDCALVRECIAPPGSSRNNHRQDQAILTILVWMSGKYQCNIDPPARIYSFHLDYSGEACPNHPGSFGVGFPSTLRAVTRHAADRLKEVGLSPRVHGSIAAVIAAHMAMQLPITPERGPSVAVAGRTIVPALRQLLHVFAQHSPMTALSLDAAVPAELLPQLKRIEDAKPMASTPGLLTSRFVKPLFGALTFVTATADVAAPSPADRYLTLLTAGAKEAGGPFGLVLLCDPVLPVPLASVRDELAAVVFNDALQHAPLVQWMQPTVVMWDLRPEHLVESADDAAEQVRAALQSLAADAHLPPGVNSLRYVHVAPRHFVVIIGNVNVPLDVLSFDPAHLPVPFAL